MLRHLIEGWQAQLAIRLVSKITYLETDHSLTKAWPSDTGHGLTWGYLQTPNTIFGSLQAKFTVALYVHDENDFYLIKIGRLTPNTEPFSKIDFLPIFCFSSLS